MNEQRIKKLAEWAGFTWYDEPCSYEGCRGHCGWRYPDGTTVHPLGMMGLPDFPNSLDACFKWLVPKAIAFLATQPIGCPSIIQIYRWLFERWIEELRNEPKPALALCLAIEKLIK